MEVGKDVLYLTIEEIIIMIKIFIVNNTGIEAFTCKCFAKTIVEQDANYKKEIVYEKSLLISKF